MKTKALLILALVWPLAGWSLPVLDSNELRSWHWLPQTALDARARTRAAAAWLADPGADPYDWRRQLDARVLAAQGRSGLDPVRETVLLDGNLGLLVQSRTLGSTSPALRSILVDTLIRGSVPWLDDGEQAAALMARPDEIWQQVRSRLVDAEVEDAELQLSAFWAGPAAQAAQAASFERAAAAERAVLAAGLPEMDRSEQPGLLAEIARIGSLSSWRAGDELRSVWQLFESLVWLTVVEANDTLEPQQDVLAVISEAGLARLARIDTGLPVVVAQLEDAAAYLADHPPQRQKALAELADAYFRLALFAPDAAFYLDQPVRDQIKAAVDDCYPVPDMVGPLPRELFEQCPERLFALLDNGLDTDELVGGASGPFAPAFLRRELGLVSWQRARYLDGYLGEQLQIDCQPAVWNSPLEWSIVTQALASWVPLRPVFFSAERWQGAMLSLQERIEAQEASRSARLDCLSGHGGQRRDPVSRLLLQQGRALADLRTALDQAYEAFTAEHTRPGSDIDLDVGADQATTYRPENLGVRPCDEGLTCGARAELPVSRALLGLFPGTYLLADQLDIGRLGLCYDQVRWEDREMRSARQGDDEVANYHGRLSFELIGTFDDGSGPDTVFRYRLTAVDRQHYLFARAGDDILALDCPAGMAGEPIASQLPSGRRGLVPNRLTYFASLPTSANAQLQANWASGAEWRDWFLSGDRVEMLDTPRPALLRARLEGELDSLVTRRERAVTARLLSGREDDGLAVAMAAVADGNALLRRVLELHYPRLVRHEADLRRQVAGSAGLLTRDQVRRRRDDARLMRGLADDGLEQLSVLQARWDQVPASVREQGQPSPEAEHARRLLLALSRLTRPVAAAAESSPAP